MRLGRGSHDSAPLADMRQEIFRLIDRQGPQAPTGPAILRQLERGPAAETASPARQLPPGEERLLYPALHSLEADWKIRADWVTDASGIRHRTYRMRRLLPRHR